MNTEENNQAPAVVEPTDGGEGEPKVESVSLTKEEYEKMNQDLGSLKRENKELKKKPKETPEKTETKTEDNSLIEKTFLRAAGISSEDEVELALTTAKKWDMPIDKLVDDEDFQSKLEKVRTDKANQEATSDVKGDGTASSAKESPEYWLKKGQPPTPEEIPDRKLRAKITRAFIATAKGSGKKFYND